MKYFFKIDSLNYKSKLTIDKERYNYGKNIYDNIAKYCAESNCYNIIDKMTLTDTQMTNYINTGILNNGGTWNISDKTEFNKLFIMNDSLILNNSTKINLTCCLDVKITSSNIPLIGDFFNKIANDDNFLFIKQWQISYSDTGDYKLYINLLSSIYKTVKKNNIRLVSPNISNLSDEWFLKILNLDIANYIDSYCFNFNDTVNHEALYNIDENFLEQIMNICKNKEVLMNVAFTSNDNYYKYYKDITTALKLYENGIVPIIHNLWNYQEDELSLLGLDFNDKNNFNYYNFVFSELNGYNSASVAMKMYDNGNIESSSFTDGKNNVLSILWSISTLPEIFDIIPNPNQYCKNIDSNVFVKITSTYEFDNTDGFQFLIIKQQAYNDSINYDELNGIIRNKFILNDNHRNSLINYLPSTYNVLECTNLYKIIRAISLELADLSSQIIITKENAYLETVHEKAIYENFGVLVQLSKKYNWNLEKYRALISGIIKSVLTGPTLQSIEDAVNLFINYDYKLNGGTKVANITIEELYKDDSMPMTNYNKMMSMFTFVVYVENLTSDNPFIDDETSEDVKNVIDVLRPAHTLAHLETTFTKDEYYRDWYYENKIDNYGNNKKFENADELELQYTVEIEDNYNETSLGMFKIFGYTETFDRGVYTREGVGSLIYPGDVSYLDTTDDERFTVQINNGKNTIKTHIKCDIYPLAMRNKIIEETFTLS